MTRGNLCRCHFNAPRLSTPMWGCSVTVAALPLGIPGAGIPKGIAQTIFSPYHHLSRAEPASQPPAPNKLSTGGWEVEEEVVVQGKIIKKKSKNKKQIQKQNGRSASAMCGDSEADLMVQLTTRNEAMLDWLSVVRMADQESIRWALAALPERQADKPVGVRRGNQWIARLVDEGLRSRPVGWCNFRLVRVASLT